MALFKKEISKLVQDLKDRLTILLNKENIEFVLDENITIKYNDTASGRIYLNIEIDIYKDNQTREKVKNRESYDKMTRYWMSSKDINYNVIYLEDKNLRLNVRIICRESFIDRLKIFEIRNSVESDFEKIGRECLKSIHKKKLFRFIPPRDNYDYYNYINPSLSILKDEIEKLMGGKYPKDTTLHNINIFLGQNPENKETYITISSGTYSNTNLQTETIIPFKGANLILILTGGVADKYELILDKQFNNIKKVYTQFLIGGLEPAYHQIKHCKS